MEKVLIISQNDSATNIISKKITAADYIVDQFKGDFNSEADYQGALAEVKIIVTVLGPLDSDLYFDQLFDAIFDAEIQLDHFIMVTYSGIDNEVIGGREYSEVTDIDEFIKQQRYAAKIVDEAEMPYTIIRAGRLTEGIPSEVKLYAEGQLMPNNSLSYNSLAELVSQTITTHSHINESIGAVNIK
ncbi:NAD(P)H-binding protein [Lentilactobacillus kosonis]|uniref:Predicted nucleoside-diphosphate-sugar epimerases n=1 Tax=Lentilactobacillus kosonis TaxID=2810561 RepID=A0A401FJP5_9LACO|nr:NAD(P)H-binding protein [Lentilactobacillus kosonis]GAY72557.1 predicted nucleoside-diphosphate-sugar epimerases [Lentilactobacillus kosonis]